MEEIDNIYMEEIDYKWNIFLERNMLYTSTLNLRWMSLFGHYYYYRNLFLFQVFLFLKKLKIID